MALSRSSMARWLLVAALALSGAAVHADEALWKLLQGGGQVVMVRHSTTVTGFGDPDGMRLDDCSTQRNLNDEGRREAARLGEELRRRGVPVGAVLSSPWCRCRDTGRIAFGREPQVHKALGFGERREVQVPKLRRLVKNRPGAPNVFLFTHATTVRFLTEISPATSEMVILTPGRSGFKVAGQLRVP